MSTKNAPICAQKNHPSIGFQDSGQDFCSKVVNYAKNK
jgi:hypothetical protein